MISGDSGLSQNVAAQQETISKFKVLPEKVSCDLYRFLEGDADAVNLYRGEYMSSYSWASDMEGIITEKKRMVSRQ